MSAFEFVYIGGDNGASGEGNLLVNGKAVAVGRIEKTVPMIFSADEAFDVGMDSGTPAGDYQAPFKFTGKLQKVTIGLK